MKKTLEVFARLGKFMTIALFSTCTIDRLLYKKNLEMSSIFMDIDILLL